MRLRMFIHINALMLAGLLPLFATGQTLPRGYEILDLTSDPLRQDKPRMNNSGAIVFNSGPRNGTLDIVLYQPDGSFVQITDDDIEDLWPDIADDGTIVWTRFIGPEGRFGPTGETMMRTPDGQITRLTDNEVDDMGPKVNSTGVVAWLRVTGFECGLTSDIWMFDGFEERAITTDSVSSRVSHQGLELNELNELVWTRYDFCNAPPGFNFASKIMMYSDGEIFEVTDGQQFPQSPDLNNLSQVVWQHYDPALDLYFVDQWESGSAFTLADDAFIPVINDLSQVAFDRWDPVREQVDIWLYRDGEFFQITRDPFDNIVPDINNKSELCWGAGVDHAAMDIHYLRRFDLGDVNCDGTIDAFDIEPFIFALFDPDAYLIRYPTCDPLLADLDESGAVNSFDIEPFLALLFP